MRKLIIAAFMFVSSFSSNVLADGHSIKMGIIRSVSKEGFLVVEFEDSNEKFKLQEIKYLS